MLKHFRSHRDFYRMLLTLSIPIALQNILSTSMSMVDTLMIGVQGEQTLAAVGICNQFSNLLYSAYWGFAGGGSLFFAQYWGVKNEKEICRSYGITLTCMLTVGLLFGAAAVFAPEFILNIYTDKPAVQSIGVRYLRIVGFSYPLQVLAMAISCLLRSTEKVRLPLIASIASMLTNTFINWLLINGNLGFPALGEQGAAIATCIGALVNVGVLMTAGSLRKDSLLLRFREQFSWNLPLCRAYFAKCLPIIFNEVMYGVGMMIINIVLGRQDEAGIAAVALFRVIEGFVFAFYNGLTSACGVMIGAGVGAGELRKTYRESVLVAFICPAVVFLICLLLVAIRPWLLGLFALSDAARSYLMTMLLIYLLAGSLRTGSYNIINIFRAGGEPFIGACFEVGTLFVITVPMVLLTGVVWRLPFLMVFASIYIEEIIKIFIVTRYLTSGRWVRPVTPEGIAALPGFMEWIRAGRKKRA